MREPRGRRLVFDSAFSEAAAACARLLARGRSKVDLFLVLPNRHAVGSRNPANALHFTAVYKRRQGVRSADVALNMYCDIDPQTPWT